MYGISAIMYTQITEMYIGIVYGFKPQLKPIYHGWDLSENLVPSLYTGWLIGIPVMGCDSPQYTV